MFGYGFLVVVYWLEDVLIVCLIFAIFVTFPWVVRRFIICAGVYFVLATFMLLASSSRALGSSWSVTVEEEGRKWDGRKKKLVAKWCLWPVGFLRTWNPKQVYYLYVFRGLDSVGAMGASATMLFKVVDDSILAIYMIKINIF